MTQPGRRVVRRRAGFGGRARRTGQFEWSRIITLGTAISAPSTKVLLFRFFPAIGLDLTVRRIRGVFSLTSDQVAADEQQQGVFGAVLANEEAFTVGAGSIPGPVTDPDAEWLMYEPFFHRFVFTSAVGLEFHAENNHVLDVRGQRILKAGGAEQSLVFIVESTGNSEGFTMDSAISVLASMRPA